MRYSNLLAMSAAIVVTAGTFALTASPAIAQQRPLVVAAPAELISHSISYADLNLASAAGQLTLDRRVQGGVHLLCTETTGGYAEAPPFAWVRCTRSAWDQARPQIRRAIERSQQIASTGTSTLAAAAITITLGK